MRVLVCGSRDWDDEEIIWTFLEGFAGYATCHNMDEAEPLVIIEGEARGADRSAASWAEDGPRCGCGCSVELERYPACWDKHGRAAGPIRNKRMLDEGKPDVVLAFHDNLAESRGTEDMVTRAKRAGVPVYIVSHG